MSGYLDAEVRHGMRSVEPSRFWRLCGRKKRHENRREAWEEIRRSGFENVKEYHCEYCGGYHVGHPRNPKRERES
jgi:hypothetical protein